MKKDIQTFQLEDAKAFGLLGLFVKSPSFTAGLILMFQTSLGKPNQGIEALLDQSCLECHDDDTKKGNFSIESLGLGINEGNADAWLKCLEQIERGFMPPKGKEQPTEELRNMAMLDLERRLISFETQEKNDPSQTVFRRLNRSEYFNTVRDLLKIEAGSDPTSEFPGDVRSHGFASNGEKLVTSNFLVRKYLDAAEDLVARAVHFEPEPEVRKWEMLPPFDRTRGQEQGQAAAYYKKLGQAQPYQDLCQRIGAGGAPFGGYHPLDDVSDEGVPEAGWYKVQLHVEAKFRNSFKYEYFTRWKPLWDGSEPIRLSLFTATLQGIDHANKEARDFSAIHEQSSQRHIATWDLPDDQEVWVEAKMWLEKGQFPRIAFPNGPTNSNYRMNTYFKDLAKGTMTPNAYAEFEETLKKHGGWFSFHLGESPRVRVYKIEMEGPLNEVWPPKSHRSIFGDKPFRAGETEEVLARFAAKAWRRPLREAELVSILSLVQDASKAGTPPETAVQEGLKAILCSPAFLYREEKEARLDNFEIASRLSYFLTTSMPDEELMCLASKGRLSDPGMLRQQALRLLGESSSDAFVEDFLEGWLRMDKLGSMAPDPHLFRVYYDDRLEPAMRKETQLYFRHLLDSNLPVREFLDSDYTFANHKLAGFYNIKEAEFAKFQAEPRPGLPNYYLRQDGEGDSPSTRFARIQFTDKRRGGLLGQASVLTLTANGVDTSPVIRGVWLIENILGTPPPKPPPNVPAIEPDIRGAKTIREQLHKHRENTACKTCHAHIDPPGFALESFDAIGKQRGHYPMGNPYPPVDPSGEYEGTQFSDVVGFKQILLKKEGQFSRCLVEKLLVHALGRDLGVADRPHVRAILECAKPQGYRLKDLVLGVVESELFARK
jgi:hypothetical protein